MVRHHSAAKAAGVNEATKESMYVCMYEHLNSGGEEGGGETCTHNSHPLTCNLLV